MNKKRFIVSQVEKENISHSSSIQVDKNYWVNSELLVSYQWHKCIFFMFAVHWMMPKKSEESFFFFCVFIFSLAVQVVGWCKQMKKKEKKPSKQKNKEERERQEKKEKKRSFTTWI